MNTERRQEPSSEDVEKVAGYVAGSYDCVYNAVHGTLYAGSAAVYFVGTFFLFEKKVFIPWDRVRQVQRLDQGVAVIDKDENVHSFTALHAPSRAWVILVSLHNDALLDSPNGIKKKRRSQLMAPELHHSISGRIMKRRNSDPASTLNFMDASQYDSEDEMQDLDTNKTNEVFRPRTKEEDGKHAQVENRDTPKRPVIDWFNTLTEPKMEDIVGKVGVVKIQGIRCVYGGYSGKLYGGNQGLFFFGRRMPWESEHIFIRFNLIRQFQIKGKETASSLKQSKERQRGLGVTTKDGQRYEFQSIDSADKVWASLIALRNENLSTEGQNRSRTYSFRRMNSDPMMPSKISFDDSSEDLATTEESDHRSTASSDSAHNLAEEWHAEVAKQKDYTNTVVNGQTLPCTMNRFLELFVLDQAPCSVAKFLESRGDSELDASEWKRSEDDKKNRIIHYKHPVNAPLAPPMAGARKEQSYRRYGDHGLCIETKTIVDDVPMADCFYVADRIRVTPTGTDAVAVTMEFNITFVKTTMFKSIIGKTTQTEFTNLFESMFRYYKENLGLESASTTIPVSDTKQYSLTPQPPHSPMMQSGVVPAMLFVLIVFQIYMVFEMRRISLALQNLQQHCQVAENEVFSNYFFFFFFKP